jgi:mannose-binding lectin 1
MGMYLAVVVAVQIMIAGAYIVYKKRRASAPKKYL